MPMDRRVLGELILDDNRDGLALVDAQRRPGDASAIRPHLCRTSPRTCERRLCGRDGDPIALTRVRRACSNDTQHGGARRRREQRPAIQSDMIGTHSSIPPQSRWMAVRRIAVHMRAPPPGQPRAATRVVSAENAGSRWVRIGRVRPAEERGLRRNRELTSIGSDRQQEYRSQGCKTRRTANGDAAIHCLRVATAVVAVRAFASVHFARHGSCHGHLGRHFRRLDGRHAHAGSKHQPQKRGQYPP